MANPFIDSVATNVVNVGMTVPGIYFVDRVGRRNLLLIGAAGMCVCEFIVAIAGVTISAENLAGQKVLIAFVCIYIVCVFLLRLLRQVMAELVLRRPFSRRRGAPLHGS